MNMFVLGAVVLIAGALAVGIPWVLIQSWRTLSTSATNLGRLRVGLARVSVVTIALAYLVLAAPIAVGVGYRTAGMALPTWLARVSLNGQPAIWLAIAGGILGLCATGFIRIRLVLTGGILLIFGLSLAAMR